MSDTPDPREERLPKWAQMQLRVLRSDLDSVRRALADFPHSSVRARVLMSERFLDPQAHISWSLDGAEDEIEVYAVQQRRPDSEKGEESVLRCTARHGRMVVSPGGGVNVITLRVEQW